MPVLDLARLVANGSAADEVDADVQVDPGSMSRLESGVQDKLFFDTRLLLVEHAPADAVPRLLALRAEHVTGVRNIDPASIRDSGIHDPHSPFLGRVISSEQPMLQMIGLSKLLSTEVAAWLFDASGAVAC